MSSQLDETTYSRLVAKFHDDGLDRDEYQAVLAHAQDSDDAAAKLAEGDYGNLSRLQVCGASDEAVSRLRGSASFVTNNRFA